MEAPVDHSLESLQAAFAKDVEALGPHPGAEALQALRTAYLGKKGSIYGLLRSMGGLPAEERPAFGKRVNELRDLAQARLDALEAKAEEDRINLALADRSVDPTLPGLRPPQGSVHLINQVRADIVDFFHNLGFQVAEGPEVDHDWYNFEALNLPADHPARDMQDTFYVADKVVLRTHTSNIQIHAMEGGAPPLRLIAPGFVYRCDNDASHSPMFSQVEGLVVDEGVSFADLKGTLFLWAKDLFGPRATLRFRPSFFPFTEPSAEMDVSCFLCGGAGCRTCKQSGWIEIGGCGCVHPNVFRNVGWDAERYTGFAFGFGIERIALLKYKIPDIGLLFRNDLRFLRQF